MEPQQIAPPPVAGVAEFQNSGGLSVSGYTSDPSLPPAPDDYDPDYQFADNPNYTIPILIALSVAIPISLLIGAIIGFVVRGGV